ncbi:energy transducer TonB [Salinibacter altiplanensis]|uniref:energy transducer TonB n=1 Tax=Salinibacter altiplanensis TaxID=1803181 RepID=UPI000C9EE229|nr:energy transducer TonB [Salinibacter altiplanensis]
MDTTTDVGGIAYPIRCMLGLVASLSLLIALVHLPLQRPASQVGWTTNASADRIVLGDVASETSSDTDIEESLEHPPPPTGTAPSTSATPGAQSSPKTSPDDDNAGPDTSAPKADRREARYATTLGATDRPPQIVGGKGSLYLNITYPKKARTQGIEGRLELEFLVEPSGSVTDIEVAKSLHPLCDSAAVDGVRSVEFIPAKVDGDPVPIRLRLPVRFRISAPTTTAQTSSTSP